MSTANTAGRRTRINNFFDVGNVGRKTGIAWKDTGVRDEHGLEPIDGLFTSPEKGTTRRSTRRSSNMGSNGRSPSSEDMEVPESSAPDPADVLSERKAGRNQKLSMPPPGRSPIKTNIGATPRRASSIGGVPTSPYTSQSANQSSPRRTPNRLLDFSSNEKRVAVVQSPTRTNGRLGRSRGKPKRNNYSLSRSPEMSREHEQERADDSLVNGVNHDAIEVSIVETDAPRLDEEVDITITEADATILSEANNTSVANGLDDSLALPPVTSSASSRKRLSDKSDAVSAKDAHGSERPLKKRATRRSRDHLEAQQTEAQPPEIPQDNVDENDQTISSAVGEQQTKEGQKKGKRREKLIATKTGASRGRPKKGETKANTSKPVSGRSAKTATNATSNARQLTRHVTPLQDEGATHTRSGRMSFKPLDFWRGERAVWRKGERLQTLDEIIRVQDLTPVKRQVNRSANSKPRKKKRSYTVFQDEEDENDREEQWEIDDGVVVGPVRVWDPSTQLTSDEEVEQQIAFAASGIEARDNPDAKFRFSKTLTLAWFGCGMVELPPGGVKRPKNSRKMQLVFFVHYGKVLVDVAGTQFTITKGGMWQVPRGNLYSIHNESDHDAKIFFAQGCEIPSEAKASEVTNLE